MKWDFTVLDLKKSCLKSLRLYGRVSKKETCTFGIAQEELFVQSKLLNGGVLLEFLFPSALSVSLKTRGNNSW